jgi:hypothetical protein
MIKKISYMVMFLLLLTSVIGSMDMMPSYPGGSNYVTNINQYYSAFFDEEGEAYVALTFDLYNADDASIDVLNVEIPGRNLILLNVLQQTNDRSCMEWSNVCDEYSDVSQTCVEYDYNGKCVRYEKPCLKMKQECLRYNPGYNRQYKQIDVDPVKLSNSYTLPINFIDTVDTQETSNFMLIYKVDGYSNEVLGAKSFEFETAKFPYMSNNVRVSINVQDGLYLKGTKSSVNYLPNTFDRLEAKGMMANDEMMVMGNSIRYQSGLVKNAQYLDPLESFSVKGLFSSSWLRVNFGRILWIIVLVLGVLALIAFGTKKLFKYVKSTAPKTTKSEKHKFIVPFMSGLFTVIALTVLWVVSFFVIALAQNMMYDFGQVFAFILLLVNVLLTLSLLIGVPIYNGNKFGSITGFFTMLSILAWIFVFMIVIFIGIALLSSIRYRMY